MKKEGVINYIDKLIIGGLGLMAFSSALAMAGSSIGFGLALLGWLIKMTITKETEIKNNPLNIPISIFLITAMISFIGSYNLTESIDELTSYLLPVILYYIIVSNISNLNTVKKLFNLGLASTVISASYALFWQHYKLGMRRVDSGWMAIDFGAVLLIYSLFTLIYLLWGSNGFKDKAKYGILLVLISLTLIYNQTRGAWLGLIGSSVLSFWFYDKKWIPIFLIIIVLVASFASEPIQSRIRSITNLEYNRSNLQRIYLWRGAIEMFQDHLINGVGLGNFKEVYEDYYHDPYVTVTSHAHNNFFNFLAETGIIGFTGFVYLIYFILKYLYINYSKIKENYYKLFVLSTFAVFLGVFVILGFFESNFYRSIPGRSVWFILGLAVVIINNLVEGAKG
ncbi:O-antigen ligase family protein [Halonatronum saccharophilum]|uniref:O-antigen ligase family protein n=1 Tax=Halonatronum saccharophilum TaxID=150060 RepID=UPI0004813706|nr:O-antigen ligase family protein [Halonatronum saccharophilum]